MAFQLPDGGAWRDVTTREFEDTVIAVAKGMVATGVEPGDTVAVMAPTRYEWAVADFASAYAGAVVVRLAEPVTRRLALAVADAVLLASQCGAVTVIDGVGQEVTL